MVIKQLYWIIVTFLLCSSSHAISSLVEEIDCHVEALNQITSLYPRNEQFSQCHAEYFLWKAIESGLVHLELHVEDRSCFVSNLQDCWLTEEGHTFEHLVLQTLEWVLLRITGLDWFDEYELEIRVCVAQIFKWEFELLYINSTSSHQWNSRCIYTILFDSFQAE